MKKKTPPKFSAVLSYANPDAEHLAKAINAGGDSKKLLHDALLDAQIHADWSGVLAVENSLSNVDNRTLARNMLSLGGRGVVIQRTDENDLAEQIPAGYKFGIAWLVTAVLLRADGDYEAAEEIVHDCWGTLSESQETKINWSPAPLCAAMPSFGPPSRWQLTKEIFEADSDFYLTHRRATYKMLSDQMQASGGHASATAVLHWGCYVTGSHDLSELLDETVWAPGLDLKAESEIYRSHLAKAVGESDELHVHPDLMSAHDAFNFGNWMMREQSVQDFKHDFFNGDYSTAKAIISTVEPTHSPYMDRLSVGFWTSYGMLKQSLSFPRSGMSLENDALHLEQNLQGAGLSNIQISNHSIDKADNLLGRTFTPSGELVSMQIAGLGTASRLIKSLKRISLIQGMSSFKPGMENLPAILLLGQLGAVGAIADHFQPNVAHRIKELLSTPGDPVAMIKSCLREAMGDAITPEAMELMLDNEQEMLVPEREIALAAQFRLAGGALAVVSNGLQDVLATTDIGEDCPVEMMRPSYDVLYLHLKTSSKVDGPDGTKLLSGVVVQHWEDGVDRYMQFDAFMADPPSAVEPQNPLPMLTKLVHYTKESVLGDIYAQVTDDDLTKEIIGMVAGVFLYMNSKDARLASKADKTEIASQLATVNRKKRKPADYERLNASFDHIEIGPEKRLDMGSHSVDSGRTVKAHYRRGYVRTNQHYGPGRLMTRPVFIPPVLVNARLLAAGEELPSKKAYTVGRIKR